MRFITSTMTLRIAACGLCLLMLGLSAASQSTDPNFPSPISANEITGTIKARDIGDARLTSYFYTFDGGQGDIFVNVVTKNFSGDVDIFTADVLRPLTKMVIYADTGVSETGRLIYLRRGERLVLRVEGRTSNDDPAQFRVKFGGSFIALTGLKANDAPTIAQNGETVESGVRVNSVGTIIPGNPNPPIARKTLVSVKETPPRAKESEPAPVETTPRARIAAAKDPETVFENKSAKVTVTPAAKSRAKAPPRKALPPKGTPPPRSAKARKPPGEPKETVPDPLASIYLVINLKDGNTIRRPMSEVMKFSVDKGVLAVVARNGKIVRYSILDVGKVTIE